MLHALPSNMTMQRELEVAVELVTVLKGPIARLAGEDRGLAEYLRRASCRLAVAVNEARFHEGDVRDELVRRALEHVSEIYSALQLAEGWGRLERAQLLTARLLLDRELHLLSGAPPHAERLAG